MVCVSTDSARQRTSYFPGDRDFRPTRMVLPLICASPWSTPAPLASVTYAELKAGLRFCVNQSETSCGAAPTVLPTRGLA